MGKGSEWPFTQRRYTNGKQVYEKMLNITNQKNATLNHNEILTHNCQEGYYQKDKR